MEPLPKWLTLTSFYIILQQGSVISHEAEIQSSNDWAAPAAWGKSGSIDRQTSIDTTQTGNIWIHKLNIFCSYSFMVRY